MKKCIFGLSIISIFALVGCSLINRNSSNVSHGSGSESEDVGSDYQYNESISFEEPEDISTSENEGEFSITTSDGAFSQNENIYTITAGGTYVLKGKLNGQIIVSATTNDEVVIELTGASISYDKDSPIKVLTADKFELSAKKGTGNTIIDSRTAKTADDDNQGEGAIYSKVDTKLKGAGTLVVEGGYSNGVHVTKDLTIQKLSLKVTGYNHAIKGNNSVSITSGEIQAFAKTGDGIKTEDNGLSSKGKQRGTISISGGTVYVDALHDGLDASYNVEINEADSEVVTKVLVKTGTYSTYYSKSSFVADSEKGIKSKNDIIINKGTIEVRASDDAIHANYGDSLDNGEVGNGSITIKDGLVELTSGDDAIHADNELNIEGGIIIVAGSVEGYEANYINISGGYSYIYGSDDGVNCAKKSFNDCAFIMTGGYLDVAVKNGDTDGIDSNGSVTISGGTIITRGSPGSRASGTSTGLDVDGECTMTGGTLIAFNGLEKSPSTGSAIYYAATSGANSGGGPGGPGGGPGGPGGGRVVSSTTVSLQPGNYILTGDGLDINFTNDYLYGSFQIYSSSMTLNSTYKLERNSESVLSWTQSSKSVTI